MVRCPSSQRRAALGPVATLLHVVHGGEVDAAALGVLDGRIHVASLFFSVRAVPVLVFSVALLALTRDKINADHLYDQQ